MSEGVGRAIDALEDGLDQQRTEAEVLSRMFGGSAEATKIGRYEIIGTAGAGAMGRVYEAHDPKLERTVAIKVIREEDLEVEVAERRRVRLIREAQALAKLSHPNVIEVFEVGRLAGEVFIVMEYVRGSDMKAWLADRDRPRAQILSVLLDAARGLAAAHAVDLVHRDFKPENVLIDDRGRAVVLDFGLARQPITEPPSGPRSDDMVPTATSDEKLTKTGSVLGTPAYMAPEQRIALAADARSDQYSFCVTAWEALTGERPKGRERPRAEAIPSRLRAALERGLLRDPDQRWASMRDLIKALQPARVRRRRRFIGATLGVGALAVGGLALTRNPVPDACADAGVAIGADWTAEHRSEMERAFEGTKLAYAAETLAIVRAGLDDYAAAWAQVADETCAGARDGSISERFVALGLVCLDERRSKFGATVTALVDADARTVPRAAVVVQGLPDVSACRDEAWLMRRAAPPDDPQLAAEVARIRGRLHESIAMRAAGRDAEALAQARSLRDDLSGVDYAPLRAEVLWTVGQCEVSTGEFEAAEATLTEAYFLATASEHDAVAISTAVNLVSLYADDMGRVDSAREWLRHAQTTIGRRPAKPRTVSRLLRFEAGIEMAAGDMDKAMELAQAAMELVEGLEDAGRTEYSHSLVFIAILNAKAHRNEEALEQLKEAYAIQSEQLGKRHPSSAKLLNNLGIVSRRLGDYEGARKYLEKSLELKIDAFGEGNRSVAATLMSLGHLARREGDLEASHDYHVRSLAIHRATGAPDNPDLFGALSNVGAIKARRGDVEGGLALLRESLVGRETAGSRPQKIAEDHIVLAEILRFGERFDEARRHDLKAKELLDPLGPDQVFLYNTIAGLSADLVGLQRYAEAEIWAEDALAHYAEGEPDSETMMAMTRFALARALSGQNKTPDRARTLAEQARKGFADDGGHAHEVAEIDAWLAALD